MSDLLKIIAALAPAIVLVYMILRKDSERPEPKRWLLAACCLGALSTVVVLLIGTFLPSFGAETIPGAIATSFIDAAIPEELVKFAMLWFLASRCKHFDEMLDGIVYAVCIGMGFAGVENILYVTGSDSWLVVSISRALLSVPAHYFFAVIMGAFFSFAHFEITNRHFYMTAAIVLPIMAHGIYDSFCFILPLSDTTSTIILLAFIASFKWLKNYVNSLVASHIELDSYRQ